MSVQFNHNIIGERQLHAASYNPGGKIRAAVLLVSPLFEEKRCAQRAMTVSAHALADAGAAVLQLDITATGNSTGDLTTTTLADWLGDIQQGICWLRKAYPQLPLALLGCRAGALLLANALHEEDGDARLILWQPVLAGKSYLQQLRKRRMIQDNITGEAPPKVGEFEVEGQELSAELYAELQELQMPDSMPDSLELCLLQCSFNDKLLLEYSRQIAKWGEERIATRRIITAPFWNPHSPGEYPELQQAVIEEVLS